VLREPAEKPRRRLVLHELDRWPGSVQERLRRGVHLKSRRHGARALAHVLDSDSRQIRAVALLDGVVDNSPTIAPLPVRLCSRTRAIDGSVLVVLIVRAGVELVQSSGQVVGVDFLVRRLFFSALPAVRRARRRRDEEEFARRRGLEVLVFGEGQLGLLAKVDADAVA